MKVEIITIGDELLTGHTIDTNAALIAEQLTSIGYDVAHITTVGDTVGDLEDVFRFALRRAQIVVTTGGLGPTHDDVTKKALVKVFKRNLIFHEEILDELKSRFKRRGLTMPAMSHSQALLPQGAKLFPNKTGSAVGICIAEEGTLMISLPGVPFEMEQILKDEVIPFLNQRRTGGGLAVTKLRTTGITESALAELVFPVVKVGSGVRLAYLPFLGGVDLRIIVREENDTEASGRAKEIRSQLESVCGKYVYGYDGDTLESIIGQLLIDNDKNLSTAESCTAGQLSALITDSPGSSAYFIGGLTAYDNEVKINQLGVSGEIIETNGAVSEECALAMALGCRKLFDTDFALSITGVAGPEGGTEDKPVGITYIGLASSHAQYVRLFRFGTNRAVNRTRATYAALEMLRREILDIK